jgi:hypothetical protein
VRAGRQSGQGVAGQQRGGHDEGDGQGRDGRRRGRLELGGRQVPGPAAGGYAERQPDGEGNRYEGGRLPGHGGGDLTPPESQSLEDGKVAATASDKDRQRIAEGSGTEEGGQPR